MDQRFAEVVEDRCLLSSFEGTLRCITSGLFGGTCAELDVGEVTEGDKRLLTRGLEGLRGAIRRGGREGKEIVGVVIVSFFELDG